MDIFVNVIFKLETCKSYKQTHACPLFCLPDLQLPLEIFPVFLTKGGFISIYNIFKATVIQFLLISEDDKSGNFLR